MLLGTLAKPLAESNTDLSKVSLRLPRLAYIEANCCLQQMFLVPQRPYCAPGNLADQITYPVQADLGNEEQMAQ